MRKLLTVLTLASSLALFGCATSIKVQDSALGMPDSELALISTGGTPPTFIHELDSKVVDGQKHIKVAPGTHQIVLYFPVDGTLKLNVKSGLRYDIVDITTVIVRSRGIAPDNETLSSTSTLPVLATLKLSKNGEFQ